MFKRVIKEYEADPVDLSIALYVATYYEENISGKNFKSKNCRNEDFIAFESSWKQIYRDGEKFKLLQKNKEFIKKLLTDLDFYARTCQKIESGKMKDCWQLLEIKKLFGVPWLIAGATLISNYPKNLKKNKTIVDSEAVIQNDIIQIDDNEIVPINKKQLFDYKPKSHLLDDIEDEDVI